MGNVFPTAIFQTMAEIQIPAATDPSNPGILSVAITTQTAVSRLTYALEKTKLEKASLKYKFICFSCVGTIRSISSLQ
jgi:hypothetical protein